MEKLQLHSRYLLDEYPITFHATLAVAIGINEAILLQKINLWINSKGTEIDGRKWIYNSYNSWQKQLPFFSEKTIKRAIKNLYDFKILLKGNFNKNNFDHTNWYSIDYEHLEELIENRSVEPLIDYDEEDEDIENSVVQSGPIDRDKMTLSDGVNLTQPIPLYNNIYNIKEDNISKDILSKKELKKELPKNEIRTTLVNVYNTNCTSLPQVQKLTDKRKKAIDKFLHEFSLEEFETVCKRANVSSFLKGENNRGWKADFDFLLRTDKATAILEGQYLTEREKKEVDNKKELQQDNCIAVDTSQLSDEDYGKLMRKEITVQQLIEEGKINVE
jgi:hypothetical protein